MIVVIVALLLGIGIVCYACCAASSRISRLEEEERI